MLMLIYFFFHTDSLVFGFQIQITPGPAFEREDIGYSTPYSKATTTPYSKMTTTPQSGMASTSNPRVTPTPNLGLEQTPYSQFGVLAIRESSLALNSQTGLMDIVQYTEV